MICNLGRLQEFAFIPFDSKLLFFYFGLQLESQIYCIFFLSFASACAHRELPRQACVRHTSLPPMILFGLTWVDPQLSHSLLLESQIKPTMSATSLT
jgi:hypothetical protein